MYNKKDIIEKNWDYIVEQYGNPEITQTEIARSLGVNPSTLNRYASSEGLYKKVKVKMTSENKKWLKENYHLPYKDLREHTKCCDEVIRLTLKEMGINRNTPYRPFKLDMSDKNFLKDLKDPTLSAPDIVKKYKNKYGIGESRIHQLRKQLNIKLQINTLKRVSTSERVIKNLLNDLDVAYIREKPIGKYHIDFYLGFKICLEVQGVYWHSKPERKISDKKKKDFLNSLGYEVIYVWDNDIDSAKNIIVNALQKLGLPIQ